MLNSIHLMPFAVDFFKVLDTKGKPLSESRSSTRSGLPAIGSEPIMSKDPLHTLWLITDRFREVDDSIPIRWVQTFVYIAQREDSETLTQEDISIALGSPQGVISKFIKKMSDRGGLGLLHKEADPNDERRKILELTSKGKKLVNDIRLILKG